MNAQAKQRDYLFDNYKVLLILLVVIGHFIEPCYKNNEFLYSLKWIIVSFHMPAFIFISGYFSKRELPLGTIIRKLAVPYVAYEIIYYFLYVGILHKETELYLLYPKFSLWYLLALFIWRAVTPYVKRIPHHLILSVIAGLLIGCSNMQDNFLSLPRVVFFYPFFLAGIYFKREYITTFCDRNIRILALAAVIGFCTFFRENAQSIPYSPKIFYGRYNYDFLGQNVWEGILCRLICYAVGFLMTFSVMLLVSKRKTFYSYIGGRTMAIYLFHGLTYSYIKHCTDLLQNIDTTMEAVLLTVLCAAMVGIFSIPQLTTFTNTIASLRVPSMSVSAFPRSYGRLWPTTGRFLYNPR